MRSLLTLSVHHYKIISVFWNLFLAMIPVITVYGLSLAVQRKKWETLKWSGKAGFVLIFTFWLFMLPNTAYLFTMVRHLVDYCSEIDKNRVCLEGTSWMVMFFFIYALAGLPTFYYSLNQMSRLVGRMFSRLSAILFPVIVIPITAAGVMVGLFGRFNSWDVVFGPKNVWREVAGYFAERDGVVNFLAFALSLYLIYYVTDILCKPKK